MRPEKSVVIAICAGVCAAVALCLLLASAPVVAQVRELTVGPDGRPLTGTEGIDDHAGLLPKGVESRGDARRRLEAYKPDPVKLPVPRTKWDGKPNFAGVYWPGTTLGTASVPNRMLRPEAKAAMAKAHPEDTSGLHCMPTAPPDGGMHPGMNVQMVHTPNVIVMINEYMNNFRIIPIDGRPLERSTRPTLQGDSIGHWAGDTLVVEVTNFKPRGFRNEFWSDSLRIIERWTRPDAKTLEYESVVDDPKILTGLWKKPKVRRGKMSYDIVQENYCSQDETLSTINSTLLNYSKRTGY